MAKKATITPVPDISNNATSVNTQLNAINDKLDNTLSLDGSTPNAMGADFDLNSNDILNVNDIYADRLLLNGTPVSPNAATVDAESVTYTPEFTGAVTSNVEAKLSETVSVKDFGAVGDGVTDDTAAIQAALDYAVPLKAGVYFPAGTYATNTTISITIVSGQAFFLKADGAVISSSATGAIFDINSADPALRGYYFPFYVEGLEVVGDGINTTYCFDVYGCAYEDSGFVNCKFGGATTAMIKIDQCWGMGFDNCQLGFGSNSRTTSGTIGLEILNANSNTVKNCTINSIGLNFDGKGIRATSAESLHIIHCAIENLEVGIDIVTASGAVTIKDNYFECSTSVQAVRDITVPFVQAGSGGAANNVYVDNNWFAMGNNAINVALDNTVKGSIKGNVHNPGLAQQGYYRLGSSSRDIEISSNERIVPVVNGVSGATTAQNTDTLEGTFNVDQQSFWIPAESFIITSGSPTNVTKNTSQTWQFATGVDGEVGCMAVAPIGWGICKLKTWAVFSRDVGGASTIVWFAIPQVIQENGTLISPSTISEISTSGAGYTTDVPLIRTYDENWIVERTTALEPVKLRFKRTGTNASDTFAGNINFYGMYIERLPT